MAFGMTPGRDDWRIELIWTKGELSFQPSSLKTLRKDCVFRRYAYRVFLYQMFQENGRARLPLRPDQQQSSWDCWGGDQWHCVGPASGEFLGCGAGRPSHSLDPSALGSSDDITVTYADIVRAVPGSQTRLFR
jgi:hypothetical protein